MLILLFELSHTKVAVTFDADASPVLQTRAPTGKLLGPTLTLLLSKPMMFHVMGVMVKFAAAYAGMDDPSASPTKKNAKSIIRIERLATSHVVLRTMI